MNHQDWSPLVINKTTTKPNIDKQNTNKVINNIDETFKIDAPKNLGQLILQARNAKSKTQKILANDIGVSAQVLSRWENGKEIHTNSNISKMEKVLLCKLPRTKKTKIVDN